jgi:hypothetical protein
MVRYVEGKFDEDYICTLGTTSFAPQQTVYWLGHKVSTSWKKQ